MKSGYFHAQLPTMLLQPWLLLIVCTWMWTWGLRWIWHPLLTLIAAVSTTGCYLCGGGSALLHHTQRSGTLALSFPTHPPLSADPGGVTLTGPLLQQLSPGPNQHSLSPGLFLWLCPSSAQARCSLTLNKSRCAQQWPAGRRACGLCSFNSFLPCLLASAPSLGCSKPSQRSHLAFLPGVPFPWTPSSFKPSLSDPVKTAVPPTS